MGLLVGAAIGFGAFVLRLVRLGKELHPDSEKGRAATGTNAEPLGSEFGDDGAIGESPGLSDALREDPGGSSDRNEKSSSDRFDREGHVK